VLLLGGMLTNQDEIDRLTERVIGCAIEVHRTLGPGLLESIYRECMLIELYEQGMTTEHELTVPVDYKGRRLRTRLRFDVAVNQCLIVEAKAVEVVRPVHKAQIITYLKLTGYPAGLLINFNETTLRAGLHRLNHPARYARLKNCN
jgi:GxxExxY protein